VDKSGASRDGFYEELECVFDQLQKYYVKMPFEDFNVKAGREYIFKTTTGNDCLCEISNNGVRVINISTLKNLIVNSAMSPQHNIHKHTWTSDWKTYEQTDHVLVDKRWNSNMADVQCFRRA
jgi:hypothetical protein